MTLERQSWYRGVFRGERSIYDLECLSHKEVRDLKRSCFEARYMEGKNVTLT
jgi:hypothetical protein